MRKTKSNQDTSTVNEEIAEEVIVDKEVTVADSVTMSDGVPNSETSVESGEQIQIADAPVVPEVPLVSEEELQRRANEAQNQEATKSVLAKGLDIDSDLNHKLQTKETDVLADGTSLKEYHQFLAEEEKRQEEARKEGRTAIVEL